MIMRRDPVRCHSSDNGISSEGNRERAQAKGSDADAIK